MAELKDMVFQALGEASMCWSETPKGVFDSTNAARIGDELMAAIEQKDDHPPSSGTNEVELIEQLADKEHDSWARWMDYLFSKCLTDDLGEAIIPAHLVKHWKRQVATPYAELSEREKQSDRNEVAHILPIIHAFKEHV